MVVSPGRKAALIRSDGNRHDPGSYGRCSAGWLDQGELVTTRLYDGDEWTRDGDEWTRLEAARRAISKRFGNSEPGNGPTGRGKKRLSEALDVRHRMRRPEL